MFQNGCGWREWTCGEMNQLKWRTHNAFWLANMRKRIKSTNSLGDPRSNSFSQIYSWPSSWVNLNFANLKKPHSLAHNGVLPSFCSVDYFLILSYPSQLFLEAHEITTVKTIYIKEGIKSYDSPRWSLNKRGITNPSWQNNKMHLCSLFCNLHHPSQKYRPFNWLSDLNQLLHAKRLSVERNPKSSIGKWGAEERNPTFCSRTGLNISFVIRKRKKPGDHFDLDKNMKDYQESWSNLRNH